MQEPSTKRELSPVRNIRMTVEYDGTSYVGWQYQTNGVSVQEVVEKALMRILGSFVRVTGSGRTDSGVHSRGQVMNFHTTSAIPARGIWRGMLAHLPADIMITAAADVPPDFDARHSACLRWYRFFLLNRDVTPSFGRQYVTHVRGRLDDQRMLAAMEMLSGNHDFSAFRGVACTAVRTRLDLEPIEMSRLPDGILMLDYRGRSFLQNMVRILTGCIVACGAGRMSADELHNMLETGVRSPRATTLAPNGLYLWRVFYGDEPDCPVEAALRHNR